MKVKPMRILHYVDENRLAWAEPWFQLLKALEEEGVENVILCRPGGDLAKRAEEKGFRVLTYRPPVTAIPQICRGVRTIIREVKPDIIHTRLSSAAALGGYWGRREQVPVVSTIDKFPKGKYYRNSELLLPCSSAVREHMENLGYSQEIMKLVPNAVHVAKYKHDESSRESFRHEMGLKANSLVVLGAGRMVDWKGFDYLIQAFALVLQNHQGSGSLSLWLGGEGPERHHLEALVRDLSIEDNVRFLGFMRDIRPVLWASDLYVHPSWGKEAFGLILLEALASGLPCIATRNGGITDIVKDGESGLLIPGRDHLKMADAISKMLRDENRTYFSGNSLGAASVFDLPRVVEATLAVYSSFEKSL